eukprot:TRINITY_DN2262_c1_g1_i1.p3 TRINITY_DN2262_c1_g1~~TRINITY_DN2262_c1_g1_i1.p3  ORF type:complete len:110 (-),score=8.68 TRINITY_DN2262_c1_g1_i1:379-684(-)
MRFAFVEFSTFWEVLKSVIEQVVGEGTQVPLVVPYVVVVATDSRYYLDISRNGAYRFLPISLYEATQDLQRIHGVNERIALEDIKKLVNFYIQLILSYDNL